MKEALIVYLKQESLDELNIPLYITTMTSRRQIPNKVIELVHEWGATRLYGNISYEIDELRRDIKTVGVGKEKNVKCEFIHDKLVVNPNTLKTKTGNGYAVGHFLYAFSLDLLGRS